MGYQEIYVRIKDRSKFDNLVDLIRGIGKEYYEENGAEPVEIITLNKAIKGDLSYMCRPYEKYNFPIGEKFIYFTGERYLQRSVSTLLNDNYIKGVEIYFTECFPSDEIFEGNEGDKYAKHEEFTWDVSCENKNTIVEGNSLRKCEEDSKKQKESDIDGGCDEKIIKYG